MFLFKPNNNNGVVDESKVDSLQELASRHQTVINERLASMNIMPSEQGGPLHDLIGLYHPTSFHGQQISSADSSLTIGKVSPSVDPLEEFSLEIDPKTGTLMLNLGQVMASGVRNCQSISNAGSAQRLRISFVSNKLSSESLVLGYNGLGGVWWVQGFLAIENTSMTDFCMLQAAVTLQFSAGGLTADGHGYHSELLPSQKRILVSSQTILDQRSTMYFPFKFNIDSTCPESFAAQYAKFKPYNAVQLVATIKHWGHNRIYDPINTDSRGDRMRDQLVIREEVFNYALPVTKLNRFALWSMLSAQEPITKQKNSESKQFSCKWTAELQRNIFGKGDPLNIDVILHSVQSAEPVTRFLVQIFEVLGHRGTGKKGGPVLEQVCCSGAKLSFNNHPIMEKPYRIQVHVPKGIPQLEEKLSFDPKIPINACNSDGEWCGYIVTHVVRVSIQGGKVVERPATLDFLEIPIVIVGCDQATCQEIAFKFPSLLSGQKE